MLCVACFAWEQAFSPVLHEVIVSELQSLSGSWVSPVHAEALMWLLLLFWDPAVPVLDCLNVDNKNLESKRWGVGGGDRDYRGHYIGGKWGENIMRESQQCLNLVRLWLPCQELNKHFICVLGSDLFWCCEFMPHKSVHESVCEDGYIVWSICQLTGTLIPVSSE